MTRGPDGLWQTLHIHFTQFNSKISKILNKIYLAVEGRAKLTPVTRLRVCSHNFPQLTAGQIISGGGQGVSEVTNIHKSPKENNFVMHVSLAQEMGCT